MPYAHSTYENAATGLVAAVLILSLCSQERPAKDPSILDVSGKSVRVLLLDARTTSPIGGTEVRVYSDNGTRCVAAPCPTNGREWKGTTDAAGYVTIPRDAIQVTASITTPSHVGNLIQDTKRDAQRGWVTELIPTDSTQLLPPVPIKLVDAERRKALADTAVRIEFRTASGGRDHIELRTNALGYVFITRTPATDMLLDDARLSVAGFQPARFQESVQRQTLFLIPR